MNKQAICMNLPAIGLTVLAARAYAQHDHEGEMVVGRTGANQLAVEFDSGETIELAPVNGLLTGWGADEPGLMALGMDEPDEGFFTLETGVVVVFELLSADPGFKVWSPGLADVLDTPGDQFILGATGFDEHPTYHIDADDPSFDPDVDEYFMTFRLLDSGITGYAPSESLTARFAPAPEPATVALIGVGAMVLTRQSGRRQVRKGEPC